ncbi:MAG: hypothetical protein HY720_00265, partial [Planctomycetes bacterium]|nr:hypothetical protein [Planctomycetota bacterium]
MFDNFSDRARRALALAREEAHALRHNFIGTEHLLLGLLREGSGVAAHLLSERSVDPGDIRKNLSCNLSPGESIPAGGGNLPFTPRALSCLQAARREAARLGQEFVGTEHVLLGLLQEPDGVAAHALRDCGLELDDLRR